MNHWQMIAIAYLLTFAAIAVEVALLLRRRRAALRQVQASLEETRTADPGAEAGAGAAS